MPFALLLAPMLGFEASVHAAVPRPTSHTVYPGQTLGMIARRYNVTIEQLCAANGIWRTARIKPGQKLVVPDENGKAPKVERKRTGSWRDYASSPKRKGYVVLETPTKRWRGHVLTKGGRVLPAARQSIERLFASWRSGKRHPIDPKLIQLVVQVSDTFGGRPIRVVSGYRERSFAVESKHLVGKALDFSIPGVPNSALKDYLRTLGPVGVGYYPNSTHVHLDVREQRTYWVDTSAPGAAPEHLGRAARPVVGDGDEPDDESAAPAAAAEPISAPSVTDPGAASLAPLGPDSSDPAEGSSGSPD